MSAPKRIAGSGKITAAGELYRAAATLLPRMARKDGRLRQFGKGENASVFRLYEGAGSRRVPKVTVDQSVVSGFVGLGLLEAKEDGYAISNAGALWLRRRGAGAEPFIEQHQERQRQMRDVAGVMRPVVVNAGESPLGWLRRRKDGQGKPLISTTQFEAGERLRADFERGQLTPRTTSNWDTLAPSHRQRRSAPGGPSELSDSALASRERFAKALGAVGPELSSILMDVCCHLIGLADTEKNNGWPQRSGKVILQLALSRLARHYGIEEGQTNTDENARTKIKHWGTGDYRPSLESWR